METKSCNINISENTLTTKSPSIDPRFRKGYYFQHCHAWDQDSSKGNWKPYSNCIQITAKIQMGSGREVVRKRKRRGWSGIRHKRRFDHAYNGAEGKTKPIRSFIRGNRKMAQLLRNACSYRGAKF